MFSRKCMLAAVSCMLFAGTTSGMRGLLNVKEDALIQELQEYEAEVSRAFTLQVQKEEEAVEDEIQDEIQAAVSQIMTLSPSCNEAGASVQEELSRVDASMQGITDPTAMLRQIQAQMAHAMEPSSAEASETAAVNCVYDYTVLQVCSLGHDALRSYSDLAAQAYAQFLHSATNGACVAPVYAAVDDLKADLVEVQLSAKGVCNDGFQVGAAKAFVQQFVTEALLRAGSALIRIVMECGVNDEHMLAGHSHPKDEGITITPPTDQASVDAYTFFAEAQADDILLNGS